MKKTKEEVKTLLKIAFFNAVLKHRETMGLHFPICSVCSSVDIYVEEISVSGINGHTVRCNDCFSLYAYSGESVLELEAGHE